jgi:Ni,Fe-hydrogenase I large subunit
MWASLKSLQIEKFDGHYRINTGISGGDIDKQIRNNGLLSKDFEKTGQKQNLRATSNLVEGICGICQTCDPLHCLLVELLN